VERALLWDARNVEIKSRGISLVFRSLLKFCLSTRATRLIAKGRENKMQIHSEMSNKVLHLAEFASGSCVHEARQSSRSEIYCFVTNDDIKSVTRNFQFDEFSGT